MLLHRNCRFNMYQFLFVAKELRFQHEEPGKDEEVIRCVCNIYKDEGKMIMCDKCEVWQHCDCMGVSDDIDNFLCEQCDPRPVNKVGTASNIRYFIYLHVLLFLNQDKIETWKTNN